MFQAGYALEELSGSGVSTRPVRAPVSATDVLLTLDESTTERTEPHDRDLRWAIRTSASAGTTRRSRRCSCSGAPVVAGARAGCARAASQESRAEMSEVAGADRSQADEISAAQASRIALPKRFSISDARDAADFSRVSKSGPGRRAHGPARAPAVSRGIRSALLLRAEPSARLDQEAGRLLDRSAGQLPEQQRQERSKPAGAAARTPPAQPKISMSRLHAVFRR